MTVHLTHAKPLSQPLQSALPEHIILDPVLNGRYERNSEEVKKAVQAMAASIRATGQHTPVKVRQNDEGKIVLVFGYCRHHAVALINSTLKDGEKPTKLYFEYEKLSEQQALIQAIEENHIRVGVTDMDHCYNIQLLRNRFKMADDEIALIYYPAAKRGEDKATAINWVRTHGALDQLVPEAVDAVNKGEIKLTTAVALAKKATPDVQRKLITENKDKLKGKSRLTVSKVLAATGKGKTAERAKAAIKAKQDKKEGKTAGDSKPVAKSAPAPNSTVYDAAETLARAVDAWLEDATATAEKALIAAHKQYRALVPRPLKAEGKAA